MEENKILEELTEDLKEATAKVAQIEREITKRNGWNSVKQRPLSIKVEQSEMVGRFKKIHDEPLKVFLSHKMTGLSREQILEYREYVSFVIRVNFEQLGRGVEIIDSYLSESPASGMQPDCWYLAKSLELMSESDLVVFCTDSKDSFGVSIERQVCEQYQIPFMDLF